MTKRQVATANPRSPRDKSGIVVAISSSCGYKGRQRMVIGLCRTTGPGRTNALSVKARDGGYWFELFTPNGVVGVKTSVSPIRLGQEGCAVQTGENMKKKYHKIREHSRQHTRCAMCPH